MGKLLQLITKLFGKNALSKTLGTRTNVIKLPSNEKKRLIKDELNIEAASELAAQKVLKEAEDLIADIPRMNDQEVLTFTGNLQRLDNKLNPPSAEVVDITTKKPVTGEGLEQLAAREGLPADVSPDSPIGRVMQGAQRLRKEKDELDKMLKDPAKQLEQEMQNPYRSGGPLDPKMGIVRTAARQVLQKLAREGKINIADPGEAKAIIEGYQGGVDPVEVFRKTFGEEALGDLANLGDELLEIDNRGGSFKELKKILEDEGFFNLQQPKNPTQGMTDEELMKLIRDEDPEEFATGGRVGFNDGGYTFEQFLKDKQQVDKFMSIEELKREYKRMMELKKIRDQRDMVATGGRVGFQTGGPTDEGILSLEEAQKLNPGMFVDTTTYNPIPEDAANKAADEIAKVIMGTLGMDDDMTSRTFIFESYVMPKRKELMEDFGLTMKEADDLIREGMAKYRTNKATGGRIGYREGNLAMGFGSGFNLKPPGELAYDATNTDIYGSSAITVTPNTTMGLGGNQIQDRMGKPCISPITGMPLPPGGYEAVGRPYIPPGGAKKIGGPYIPPPGIDLPANLGTPMGPTDMRYRDPGPGIGTGLIDRIDMTRPPGTPSGNGALTVMPRYNDPLPQDQLLSGFEEYKKTNPLGAGTTAMVPVTLPGGYSHDFSGSAEANAFRKYLESIGQAPYQGRPNQGMLAKLEPLSPLAATAYYSNGGRVGFQKGSPEIFDQLEMDVPYPYGHRVNYQTGGEIAYDATDPIYGSSAITITPDTIMGPQGNQIQAQTGVNQALQRPQNFLEMFKDHAVVSQAMKGKSSMGPINQYGMQTGYDFQEKSKMNPIASSILASGYQLATEGLGMFNPKNPNFLNPVKAFKTAQSDTTKNIEGILASESRNLTQQQQEDRNKYLANQGQVQEPFLNPTSITKIETKNATPTPFEKYKAKMLEAFRKNHAGQKTAITDIQPDGTHSGTPKEIPIEDYFAALIAQIDRDPAAYGYASGGRVGYAYGSGLKLIQILQKLGKNLKTEIKKAVDDLIPSGDPKLDADMAVDNMLEDLNIDRDTIDQYDVLDAYGLAYDELKRPLLKEIEKTKSLAPKMIERFELMEKYPGIDENLLTSIVEETDSQKKAEVISTIEQAFELMRRGKSPDEILAIFKKATDRTKQAGGGLNYLSGF